MNIPTAEQELENTFRETGFDISNPITKKMVIVTMQVYAQKHVEAALQEACENARKIIGVRSQWSVPINNLNKESILNSYPLDNIK